MALNLKTLETAAKKGIETAQNLEELDKVFKVFLGRKGQLNQVLRAIPKLAKQKRAKTGKEANALKNSLERMFAKQKIVLQAVRGENQKAGDEWIDVTAPGKKIEIGHLHPITLVQRKMQEIFQSMGFEIASGPEIETEWYNFDALNIPKDHPARDMWDTFWIKTTNNKKPITNNRLLLRTHTSPVQIRYMETHKPPLRIIAPGRAFRYEATDARHGFNFYQLEGLMVGNNVTAANFKAILQEFFRRFFGKPVTIRLRPSYFPFTEPSFEVDMAYDGGWIEIMGAGMVHPNVLKAVNIDPQKWQGFAFGMGIERLAMMKYKINDIRLFYSGDLRFLQQF